MTLPLLSSKMVPRIAKVALALYMAYFVFPQVSLVSGKFASYSSYVNADGKFTLEYILLLGGEALIGMVIGFYINIIFAVFSTAGQFFAFQMGFSAAEAYDSLSQVENPLMGQFFNLLAMLVFMQNNWFQMLFLGALKTSFQSLNSFSIISSSDHLMKFMLSGLVHLFANALVIALPLMGTLFLINVAMGILSKAAPQMNLLSEGFPTLMLTSFFVIWTLLPEFFNFFTNSFVTGFRQIERLFISLGGGGI
ncbi:MAG: flagellar biosynthetic protein FliR [Treponema sp.]|nr:flagellar biosynthetic protein FliR [Treponema sp.]MBP5576165.1 flagellar biosynthetic protein FliR [Treponema sp.]